MSDQLLLWPKPRPTDTNSARKAPKAATGAANRLGKKAPTANPAALNAVTAAAPTATHHHGGEPWSPWPAYTANMTPTKTRYAPTAQIVAAAQAASCAAQRGRTAPAIKSAVPRLPSRDAIQAATPATKGAKSTKERPCPMFQNVRSTQYGGVPVANR